MMLPDELEWVLEMLGYRWPTADEDKLRDCAEVWRQFGEKVTELHGTANGAARQVTAHNAGESIDKFVKTYEKFDGGGGGDGYLRNAAEAAFLIANVLEACAYLVEFAKWAVIAQLIALAIEIVAAHAAAPFTFGLSEVAGLGATQVTRLIVRRLLDELKKALLEAIVETMKEPAISAIEAIITDLVRQTVNVGFGAQEGYDVGATLKAGGTAGLDALKQSPQTFAEGVRDSLGQKAGSRARHAIDSRIDGYDGASGLPDGDVGSAPGSDSGSRSSSSSSDSPSSNSSSSNSDGNSGTSSADSNGSDSSTSTRSGNSNNLPGTNIGNGISADTGGNNIGGPNVGAGPDSGSGPGSDSSSPSSSDTPYSRPAQSPSDSSLSDFDDPSPGGRSPGGSDSPANSPGTPSTSGPSHSGGSQVSGLSSPSPQSAPAHASSSSSPSSSPTGGSIGTQIDSLAATAPTQTNAAPTTNDSAPTGSGGRPDGGSGGMPTSPTAAAPAGTTPAASHSSGGPSAGSTSPTSPNANSGPARNPSANTPGTAPAAGTGPASTPRPTSPTVPRSTPTPDGRVPGAGDSRTPGTPDGRIPAQRPGGTPTGDAGTTPRNTPGTPTGDRTAPRGNTPGSPATAGDGNTPRPRPTTTTPNDGTASRTNTSTTPHDNATSRNNPGTRPSDTSTPRNNPTTTPGDNSTSRNNPGTTPSDRGDRTPPRTTTPGNPSTAPRNDSTAPRSTPDQPGSSRTPTPGQNPTQSSPSRTTPPSTTSPSTSTPGGSTPHSPSTSPGPATPNQPGTGTTPSRPPQQPAGSTPNQPGPQTQPQPHTQQPPASTPNHQQQSPVTPVPIHHVTTTPSGQATPSAPHNPDSGGPTTPDHQSTTPDTAKPRDVPTPASETRNTNPPGGVTDPTRAEQDALENSVPRDENGDPTRPPDPADGPWVQRINGEGPDAPGRSNNCVDTALSTVDTYAGNPTAAGARTPDLDADGNPSDRGERGGRDRIENTLGARFSDLGNGRDAFNRLENTLRDSGHGSQAVIITQDANGRAHAWNAVNHNGKITYIDAQTGQQSRNPLHSGDHGVFAIPLDSNRQPVVPDKSTAEASIRSERRAPETAGSAPQNQSLPKFDSDEVRGSAEFGERQKADHTHINMPLEESQATLRQTHDVSQVDLGPVLQNAHGWAKDGSLAQVVDEVRKNKMISQDRLNQILGDNFTNLNDDQKLAVIAGIARISNTFHEGHAAGNSPINTDPQRRRPKGEENGISPLPGVSMHENTTIPRMRPDTSPSPASLAREYAVNHDAANNSQEARDAKHDEFDKIWKNNKDNGMRPDMSGKNYAVLEVHEKTDDGVKVHYVIDTSIPGSDRYHHDHSEPHLGEWMRAVEKEKPGTYKAVSLFTEFEPCGNRTGTGGANCSDYLSHDMERDSEDSRARTKKARENRPEEQKANPPKSDLRISYGIGYRKGDMGFEAAAREAEYDSPADRREAIKAARAQDIAMRQQVKATTDQQMVRYRGEWLRVWMKAAGPAAE
ncbi:toxin glutamine deamidase domain-containing protein [Streptomyces sp. NPDC059805]|uniref:toxin glutamine deamidase domain-containing protein n=1 Tax=Streptomyces sp. NPDC059805 TaxID=3346954 RepID=UPI0036476C0A